MTELEAASKKEQEAKQLREIQRERDEKNREDSETETEAAETVVEEVKVEARAEQGSRSGGSLQPEATEAVLRKRRNSGEASGDLSTDSEWDKVEDEEDMDR